jgi:hypothetical protein
MLLAVKSVEIGLGGVIGGGGELRLSARIDADGRVWVELYATSLDARSRGVLIRLRPDALDALEAKISEAKEAVRKLEAFRK